MFKCLGLIASLYHFVLSSIRTFIIPTSILLFIMSISSSHAIELKGAERKAPELKKSEQANWSSEVIDIERVTPTLYLVRSYQDIQLNEDEPAVKMGANSFIYIDKHDAYLIDTPWNVSDMPDLMSWLQLNGLTLKGALVTHYHADSAAGLGYLDKAGFATYASDMTNTLLKKEDKPVANHTFLSRNFEFVKGRIETFFPGAGHSMDNLVVWLPGEQILIGGCFLKSNHSNHLGWTGDADLENWYHAANRVNAKYPDVKLAFPGHGKGVKGAVIIEHTMAITKEFARSK